MPGILAVTVRRTEVMEKPSPSLSMTISDLLSTFRPTPGFGELAAHCCARWKYGLLNAATISVL
jgi:hypothetical protein